MKLKEKWDSLPSKKKTGIIIAGSVAIIGIIVVIAKS